MTTPLEQVIGYGVALALLILVTMVLAAAGLFWLERNR